MAPFTVGHCAICERKTTHRLEPLAPQASPLRAVCEECGNVVTDFGPKDDEYCVVFTNCNDLFAKPAAGQYYLVKLEKAGSEGEALQAALTFASELSRRVGLPPHGIRVSESDLRRQATVVPAKKFGRDRPVAAGGKRDPKSHEW
jgi:hypothetical protein